MTPFEMLSVLDDAVARAPRRRWWQEHPVALELTAPSVRILDTVETGTFLGNDTEGTPTFGYSTPQCERLRTAILTAARDDAKQVDQ
ncbi:hypothetical protein BH10ACT3_BH10ACT3_17180 [soil metagenome]